MPEPTEATPPMDKATATQADEFTRGYLIAVSNLIGGWGASTETSELLCAIDATPALIRKFDFAEYDLANLRAGLRAALNEGAERGR